MSEADILEDYELFLTRLVDRGSATEFTEATAVLLVIANIVDEIGRELARTLDLVRSVLAENPFS